VDVLGTNNGILVGPAGRVYTVVDKEEAEETASNVGVVARTEVGSVVGGRVLIMVGVTLSHSTESTSSF
jgi:hypothetical protein